MKGQLVNNNNNKISNTTSPVSSNNNPFMINLTEYQAAQAFAQKALDTFNETKENPATNSLQQPAAITKLDDSLGQFKNAIDNMDSYDTVFRIAEYQVVPNLQTVYNLKTKS
jgi:phosphopentomutase